MSYLSLLHSSVGNLSDVTGTELHWPSGSQALQFQCTDVEPNGPSKVRVVKKTIITEGEDRGLSVPS